VPPFVETPIRPNAPNPGLAALLGFIPGVGAFYNGQYAKGIVHLIVFAILTTLADDNKLFVLFVFGWEFYQVIEAHHTARARRDGTPLPNPFGLNDIGERLGFGRSWPPVGSMGASAPGPMPGGTTTSGYGSAYSSGNSVPPVGSYVPPMPGYGPVPASPSAWGAPAESYADPLFNRSPGMPPVPFAPSSRVPTGAIVLIGLGVLFLVGNSGLFRSFPIHRLLPFLLIGFGVWLFVRKMLETGVSLADDGSALYRIRIFRALRGPVWIILVGVLFLLDSFHILSWGRSWPLFIIVGGVMTFLERTAYTGMPAPYPYAAAAEPVAPAAAAPVSESTWSVPPAQRDGEEK
jgi:hypothetical protein